MNKLAIFFVLLSLAGICSFQAIAEESATVDLTKLNLPPRPPRKKIPFAPVHYFQSGFTVRFANDNSINTEKKLQDAAMKVSYDISKTQKYVDRCGDFDLSEIRKEKYCDFSTRSCKITIASKNCHFLPSAQRCPSGSEDAFPYDLDTRGFKVCEVHDSAPDSSNGGDRHQQDGSRAH